MARYPLLDEIGFVNFLTEKEVFDEFYKLKDILKDENDDVVLGFALIKAGFVLPGFRLLYRSSSLDNLKRLFYQIVTLPKDYINIFIQISTLNDTKLSRFISALGILPNNFSFESLKAFDVKEIITNAIPTDIRCTKILKNSRSYYINYYLEESDEGDRLVALINGNKFYLPSPLIYFIEEGHVEIDLKGVFEFGFPEERVFLSIIKDYSLNDPDTVYFDPSVKIDSLVYKIENNKPIDFFYDFLNLLLNEFEMVNSDSNKRKIISSLSKKKMLWVLIEMKNVVSTLCNFNHSNVMKILARNIEFFVKGWEFDTLLRNTKIIKVITPLFNFERYTSREYLLTSNSGVMLVFEGNDIKVVLKNDNIVIGEINPNTTRLVSEMGAQILSVRLIKGQSYKPLDNPLNEFYEFWLEMDVAIL